MNSTKVNGSHHEMILLADLCPEIEVIWVMINLRLPPITVLPKYIQTKNFPKKMEQKEIELHRLSILT